MISRTRFVNKNLGYPFIQSRNNKIDKKEPANLKAPHSKKLLVFRCDLRTRNWYSIKCLIGVYWKSGGTSGGIDGDKNSNGCSLLSHEIHRPDNDFVMARIEINSAPALYGTKCTERPVHHHWPPRCNWLFMFTGSTLFLHQQRKANTGYNSPIPRLSLSVQN